MYRLLGALSFCAIILCALPALATKHRRPFDGTYRITAGYDNNSGGGCTDYGCGSRCYNGHTGTDYGLPFNTAVRASASGVVSATNNGCGNVGSLGNTCGGRCGNYVQLRHDDGSFTIYCHMKNGGLSVGNGQRVSCGQVLGYSASSGSSTGNHLHHGWKPGAVSLEPFKGSCGRSSSAWVKQNAYDSLPSTTCETTCDCNPGQKQTRGCGNCGEQTRTCAASCKWGGWSSCKRQGSCKAGATESRPCCDCGTQTRRCSNACEWVDWSRCSGADPSPTQACETGLSGVCAKGTRRCIEGCLTCAQNVQPSDELCDDIDNNCDGQIDDGSPSEMGERAPDYAVDIIGFSMPGALAPGEVATAWVHLKNVGEVDWSAHDVIVRAVALDPTIIETMKTNEWLAYDVPARLGKSVASGETATLSFKVRASAKEGARVRFVLSVLGQGAMMCPRASLDMDIATLTVKNPPSNVVPTPSVAEDGCAQTGQGTQSLSVLWLLILGLLFGVRRRFC